MKRQKHMAQRKEQIKTPQKELNKMEISNLSDAEFKTLVVKKNQDGGVGRHTAPPRTTTTDKIEQQGSPTPRK